MRTPVRISVALPVYNELEILPELLERLRAVLRPIPGGPHQIVFADDGSSDGSFEFLEHAARVDPNLVVVRLARNFGHQVALSAAIDHANGDVVVLMDSDLQDAPEAIPLFLERYHEGNDVVYAQRERRKENALLRACYFLFYRTIARLSRVDLPVDAGDFSLLSRRVVDLLRQAPERHRYLRGLRAWAGFRQAGVAVERAARTRGESKYTFRRLVTLALDGVFSFSVVPLRAAATVGMLAVAASCVFALYSVVAKVLMGRSPQGFTALIVIVTFLSGMQLIFLGVLGEYVGRIFEEVKRRPLYVVDQVIRSAIESRVDAAVRVHQLHEA
jgi:dolichol-phosphate mannosyltransferase